MGVGVLTEASWVGVLEIRATHFVLRFRPIIDIMSEKMIRGSLTLAIERSLLSIVAGSARETLHVLIPRN